MSKPDRISPATIGQVNLTVGTSQGKSEIQLNLGEEAKIDLGNVRYISVDFIHSIYNFWADEVVQSFRKHIASFFSTSSEWMGFRNVTSKDKSDPNITPEELELNKVLIETSKSGGTQDNTAVFKLLPGGSEEESYAIKFKFPSKPTTVPDASASPEPSAGQLPDLSALFARINDEVVTPVESCSEKIPHELLAPILKALGAPAKKSCPEPFEEFPIFSGDAAQAPAPYLMSDFMFSINLEFLQGDEFAEFLRQNSYTDKTGPYHIVKVIVEGLTGRIVRCSNAEDSNLIFRTFENGIIDEIYFKTPELENLKDSFKKLADIHNHKYALPSLEKEYAQRIKSAPDSERVNIYRTLLLRRETVRRGPIEVLVSPKIVTPSFEPFAGVSDTAEPIANVSDSVQSEAFAQFSGAETRLIPNEPLRINVDHIKSIKFGTGDTNYYINRPSLKSEGFFVGEYAELNRCSGCFWRIGDGASKVIGQFGLTRFGDEIEITFMPDKAAVEGFPQVIGEPLDAAVEGEVTLLQERPVRKTLEIVDVPEDTARAGKVLEIVDVPEMKAQVEQVARASVDETPTVKVQLDDMPTVKMKARAVVSEVIPLVRVRSAIAPEAPALSMDQAPTVKMGADEIAALQRVARQEAPPLSSEIPRTPRFVTSFGKIGVNAGLYALLGLAGFGIKEAYEYIVGRKASAWERLVAYTSPVAATLGAALVKQGKSAIRPAGVSFVSGLVGFVPIGTAVSTDAWLLGIDTESTGGELGIIGVSSVLASAAGFAEVGGTSAATAGLTLTGVGLSVAGGLAVGASAVAGVGAGIGIDHGVGYLINRDGDRTLSGKIAEELYEDPWAWSLAAIATPAAPIGVAIYGGHKIYEWATGPEEEEKAPPASITPDDIYLYWGAPAL